MENETMQTEGSNAKKSLQSESFMRYCGLHSELPGPYELGHARLNRAKF
jgi:hypothetical protein